MCGQVRFDVGVKNSFDVLLVDSKMTVLPNVSTGRWWSSYLRRAYIKLHSLLFTLDVVTTPLAYQVACFRVVQSRWPHYAKFFSVGAPLLIRGVEHFFTWWKPQQSYKVPHDFLAPCNSCLLVVLENQSLVHSWLVDELHKLQSYLELCRVHPDASVARNCKMGNVMSIGIGPRIRLRHSSQRMTYYSRYATERKDIVLGVSLLQLVTFEP
jgi:hypothetical protein